MDAESHRLGGLARLSPAGDVADAAILRDVGGLLSRHNGWLDDDQPTGPLRAIRRYDGRGGNICHHGGRRRQRWRTNSLRMVVRYPRPADDPPHADRGIRDP